MIATNDFVFLFIVQSFYLLSLWEYIRLMKFRSIKFDENIIKSNFLLSKTKIDINNFLLILLLVYRVFFFILIFLFFHLFYFFFVFIH